MKEYLVRARIKKDVEITIEADNKEEAEEIATEECLLDLYDRDSINEDVSILGAEEIDDTDD